MSEREPLPFQLLAISDRRLGEPDLAALAAAAAPAALLFRDKDLAGEARHRLARELRAASHDAGLPLIVHGDEQLAREVGAEGLHLPASEPPRRIEGLIVGCSCHDADELERAAQAGVDYATLSPVLCSPGKGRGLGWKAFSALATRCPLPVFALGGLGPADLEKARRRGAWGVAGIRSFLIGTLLLTLLSCSPPG